MCLKTYPNYMAKILPNKISLNKNAVTTYYCIVKIWYNDKCKQKNLVRCPFKHNKHYEKKHAINTSFNDKKVLQYGFSNKYLKIVDFSSVTKCSLNHAGK